LEFSKGFIHIGSRALRNLCKFRQPEVSPEVLTGNLVDLMIKADVIKLEVSTQILSPIGDDEKVLPDFSYLRHRETFEENINSSLDISLRNQHGASIRHGIQKIVYSSDGPIGSVGGPPTFRLKTFLDS